jgi:hypothetical protein
MLGCRKNTETEMQTQIQTSILSNAVGFYTTNDFFPVNHSITTKKKDVAMTN